MAVEDLIVGLRLQDKLTAPLKATIARLEKVNQKQKQFTQFGQKMARQQLLVNRTMRGGAQKLVDSATRTNKLTSANDSFSKVMSMNFETWKKVNQQGGEFVSRGGKVANKARQMTHGLRGFKMEMLSVMFFGMGMKNFFSGLLKPALQAVGIFDLWGATLQLLFLPIAMVLLDTLMPLFLWLMNLSDATKLMIGKFVLIGIAAGLFLFLLGMIVLGIGGIIMVFGGLFTIVDKVSEALFGGQNAFSSFMAFGMTVGILSKAFSFLKDIVSGLFNRLLEIDFIKQMLVDFGITVDKTGTVWEQFKEIVVGVWDEIKESMGLAGVEFGEDGFMGTIKGMFPTFDQLKEKIAEWKEEFKIDEMVTSIGDLGKSMEDLIPSLESIADLSKIISRVLEIAINNVTNLMGNIRWVANKLGIEDRGGKRSGASGTFQSGGYVPHTGLYKLHAGENVSQAGSSFSPNITVYASSNVDIDMLKSQLSSTWNDELGRLSRR